MGIGEKRPVNVIATKVDRNATNRLLFLRIRKTTTPVVTVVLANMQYKTSITLSSLVEVEAFPIFKWHERAGL